MTIMKLIEKRGGLEALKMVGHFKFECKGYMPLSVDWLGTGPHGYRAFSVAHNYIQNGDVMADPDMQVEAAPGLTGSKKSCRSVMLLHPYTYQQDGLGLYQEVYAMGPNGKPSGVRPRLKRQLEAFLRNWEKCLKSHGYLEAEDARQAVVKAARVAA